MAQVKGSNRMRRKFLVSMFIVGVAIVVLEIVARYGLGLGDPPLSIRDTEIDYIFAPNQNCHRFGNRIVYNNVSMRCDFNLSNDWVGDRVFVVGDSVVNGGVLTDHKDLATTLLQEALDPSATMMQVCHVSAGSWGPGNYAAYFRKYKGLIGTNDIIVIEVNSHDLWEDDPSLTQGNRVGNDIALPDHKPFCALSDGFWRYFVPLLRRHLGLSTVNTKVDVPKWGKNGDDDQAKYNLKMLDEIFQLPWKGRFLLIWRSREESAKAEATIGEKVFIHYAKERGITVIDVGCNTMDYRDAIHPSIIGQRKMFESLKNCLESSIERQVLGK